MDKILIVSKWNNDLWSTCKTQDDVPQEIDRAVASKRNDLMLCTRNLVGYPANAEYWTNECYRHVMVLREGYEAIGWEEYERREREKWLSKKVEEITLERYYEMEPFAIKCHRCGNYEFFNNREMTSENFTTQYVHNFKTGKCYCATVDVCDPSTWILVKFFHVKNEKRQIL